MDYSAYDNANQSIQDIVYGNFLKDEPCLRLIHLKSLERMLNKFFHIGSYEPTVTMETLFYACQTAKEKHIVEVMTKLIEEIKDLELIVWSRNTYDNEKNN